MKLLAGLLTRLGGPWMALAIVLALGAAVAWIRHGGFEAGLAQGRSEVTAVLLKERKEARERYEAAMAAQRGIIQRQREISEETERELIAERDAALASGRQLGRMLAAAQARMRADAAAAAIAACGVAPGGQEPGGSPAVAELVGAIGEATADLTEACADDARRVNGWVRWWGKIERSVPVVGQQQPAVDYPPEAPP